ncbi:MAG TPA: NAD(P)/FAD-dependent oxidoreductase [Gaiellaceae bacterium]|nr:NAD(P)/FAD-dependent oxidoreductase [Gaiellaceae bacterium]
MHVVVLGGGSTGQAFVAALRRHDSGCELTLVERRLVGGECSYFACMPSKTLLRAPEVVAAAALAPGAEVRGIDAERVFAWRDRVTGRGDDSSQEEWLAERDVRLVRGDGRVERPGVVSVDGEELAYDRLVIATGSEPAVPPVDGLAGLDYWTNREATTASEVPESLVVVGGGPVGAELAQFFRRLGSRVTVVDHSERLLAREDAQAGALLADVFAQEGIELALGTGVARVEPGFRVTLEGGRVLEAERLLVATGRRPNTEGFGFEQLGLEISRRGIEVDERLRAAEGVWAIGDVTGIAMFTHVGKYQARVAAADLAGLPARADYRAIPRSIFTDPQVAAVGRTEGDGLVSAEWKIDSTARTSTFERPKRPGFVKLVADPERRVLVGAVAAGPEAGEWLQQICLAIRAEVPVDVLRETIQPYPTFSEALFFAARDLPL